MDKTVIFVAGSTASCRFAGRYLSELGLAITSKPSDSVTHVLLDIPSFNAEQKLRSGESAKALFAAIPRDVIVFGGNLNHPVLEPYQTVDFLRDSSYLAENAYITAECALDVALPYLTVTLRNCPTLIIGWGRIGKCLGKLLGSIGADVTIAARKESDRAMIRALGYHPADPVTVSDTLSHYRLIYNTVPAPVLNKQQLSACREDCIKIELASSPGLEDEDVIIARGLPGIHTPETTGTLIAKTLIKYL